MKLNTVPIKRLFFLVFIGTTLFMAAITLVIFGMTRQLSVLIAGILLILCSLIGLSLLTHIFGKRLSLFAANLCQTVDNMIDGKEEPEIIDDSETLLARINHRLSRLYQIMQENQRKQSVSMTARCLIQTDDIMSVCRKQVHTLILLQHPQISRNRKQYRTSWII